MKIRRPMKPATLSEFALEEVDESLIHFPVYGTPKFDGIRCCIQNGKALTYNLKHIPNDHIRKQLEDARFTAIGMDGELVVQHTIQDYFNNTQSGVMSKHGKPDFKFYVFDYMPQKKREEKLDYRDRIIRMQRTTASFIEYVIPVKIRNMRELAAFEKDCLRKNYEGFVIRTGESPYKYGRSTLKQFWMVKYKRFHTSEARVIGFNELMSNQNKATRNVVGDIKRSSKKAGMVPMNMLGSLDCIDAKTKVKFRVSGFTLKQRKEIWRKRKKYMDRIFTYRHQLHGAKDKPRFDTFKGWRPENE